ncbi:MAG TPA: ABC transporter substrate-binding protein, partial [Armatimonadota bacterium]|nr:ABC transporter substrate-binding protein [Armatimonadota bacterium]
MQINQELQSTWVRNFNPFSPDVRTITTTIIYEPLMVYNKVQNKLVPWLADDYSWSADNKVLTFKLHPGVQWSDGQPFSSKDALYTFNLIKDNSALASPASAVI